MKCIVLSLLLGILFCSVLMQPDSPRPERRNILRKRIKDLSTELKHMESQGKWNRKGFAKLKNILKTGPQSDEDTEKKYIDLLFYFVEYFRDHYEFFVEYDISNLQFNLNIL